MTLGLRLLYWSTIVFALFALGIGAALATWAVWRLGFMLARGTLD